MDESIDSQNKADKALKELVGRRYQPYTTQKLTLFQWLKKKVLEYLLS